MFHSCDDAALLISTSKKTLVPTAEVCVFAVTAPVSWPTPPNTDALMSKSGRTPNSSPEATHSAATSRKRFKY